MHSTTQQQSNHSSKSANGATVTSSLKNSPDSMQNSSSYPSQAKGKKRDRTDQNSESTKRERSKKHHDGDSVQAKSESSLKSEIAKITEKGGLVDSESVQKLVQLMQRDKSQRRVDLSCRSLIAGLLAATEKFDCLSHFVQLRGFVVLDEWLQEVHKGKAGYSGGVKDSDKSVDEFLLILLRALDKLPINLNALKLCNIGKSVNHLRSHKNSEIQRKSRSLVDTWKKRVEAEMNSDENKSTSSQLVPWAGRSRHEVPHGSNRHGVLSSTSAVKSPAHVTTSKSASVKHAHGESAAKASSTSSGPQKSSSPPTSTAENLKEGQLKAIAVCGHSEPAQITAKDERSSSSSQSQTNSHCSSDLAAHMRNSVPSEKEDARSSTARSKSSSKFSSSTRPKKLSTSLHKPSCFGVQKDTMSGEICTLTRDSDSEKVSQSNTAGEDALSTPVVEGNSHKIIVKISNRGRSSGKSNHTGPAVDVSCKNGRTSSPDCSQKLDHSECSSSKRNISSQGTEIEGLPLEGKQGRADAGVDPIKQPCPYKVTCSPSKKDTGAGLPDSSFSATNISIESSLKSIEGTTSTVGCDDVWMGPSASVAAEGVPKCSSGSPVVSPLRNLPKVGNPSSVSQGIPAATGGASGKSREDLLQQEESLKSLRKLNEIVGEGSAPFSSTCIVDKSALTVAVQIHTSKHLAHDETPGPSGDTSQTALSSFSAEDVVRDEIPVDKGPGKGADVAMQCISLRHDDQKSTSVQEFSSSAALEQKHPSPTCSALTSTIDGQVIEFCGADPPVLPETSSNLKACDSDYKGCSKVVDVSENQKIKPASRFSSADLEHKIVSKDESSVKNEHLPGEPFLQDLSAVAGVKPANSKQSDLAAAKAEPKEESVSVAADISVSAGALNSDKKLEFDLNEGFNIEDVKHGEQNNSATFPLPALSRVGMSYSPSLSFQPGSLPTSVTVTAAAKRPFVPPEDLLKNKSQLGWKGSAATSAFRPAEPRKIELQTGSDKKGPFRESVAPKQVHPVLDIDLNVTDEQMSLDIDCQNSTQEVNRKTDGKNCKWNGKFQDFSLHSPAGFELDLNREDDALEAGQPSINQSEKFLAVELSRESSIKRDFDLNDGPSMDETTLEPLAHSHFNFTKIPPQNSFGPRMSSPVVGNISQWCSPGGICSGLTTPSTLPDSRGEPFPLSGVGGSQRMLSVPTGPTSVNPDLYQGPMLPSSPAMSFGTTAFQYPVFPFGSSFQLSTSFLPGGSGAFVDPSSGARYCAPAIPAQFVGTSGAFSSQFALPCVANVPNVSTSTSLVDSSGKWSRQALDLNFGPGGGDTERRDVVSHMTSRQLLPQVLTEEQARVYQAAGGSSKRKEPEGGGETEKLNFKQQLWQ